MIINDREYRITERALRGFEDAISAQEANDEPDPSFRAAMRAGLEGQAESLRRELEEYTRLQTHETQRLTFTSLQELVEGIAAARKAAGLTQTELGERLGVDQQQVQRDEARRFRGASHERLQQIMEILGIEVQGSITLPGKSKSAAPVPSFHR